MGFFRFGLSGIFGGLQFLYSKARHNCGPFGRAVYGHGLFSLESLAHAAALSALVWLRTGGIPGSFSDRARFRSGTTLLTHAFSENECPTSARFCYEPRLCAVCFKENGVER